MSESKQEPTRRQRRVEANAPAEKPETGRVRFHFDVAPNYQEHFVQGVYGGPTPRGQIHMAFFTERAPIPRHIEHELKDDGTLGDAVQVESRPGYVRYVHSSVVMEIDTARSMLTWLEDKIEALERTKPEHEDHESE